MTRSVAQSETTSETAAAKLAMSVQFDDTIIASELGFQLHFVRVLLTRPKAACSIEVPLLSPLTLIEYEQALQRCGEENATDNVEDLTASSQERERDQWLATSGRYSNLPLPTMQGRLWWIRAS